MHGQRELLVRALQSLSDGLISGPLRALTRLSEVDVETLFEQFNLLLSVCLSAGDGIFGISRRLLQLALVLFHRGPHVPHRLLPGFVRDLHLPRALSLEPFDVHGCLTPTGPRRLGGPFRRRRLLPRRENLGPRRIQRPGVLVPAPHLGVHHGLNLRLERSRGDGLPRAQFLSNRRLPSEGHLAVRRRLIRLVYRGVETVPEEHDLFLGRLLGSNRDHGTLKAGARFRPLGGEVGFERSDHFARRRELRLCVRRALHQGGMVQL